MSCARLPRDCRRGLLLLDAVEGVASGVGAASFEFVFDAHELVVFGNPVRAAHGTGFDLSGFQSDDKVGDGGVGGFSRAVGDNGRITGPLGHLNRFVGFGEGADLVHFDKDGVAHAHFDTLLQDVLCW